MVAIGIPALKNLVIAKTELHYLLLTKPKLIRGAAVYQNVENLILLRNALIHYMPEWLPTHVALMKEEGLVTGRYRPVHELTHKPIPLRHRLAVNEFLLKALLLADTYSGVTFVGQLENLFLPSPQTHYKAMLYQP